MPSNLGACPRGAGSVAAMRLVLMAQGDSPDVLRQFRPVDPTKLFFFKQTNKKPDSEQQKEPD